MDLGKWFINTRMFVKKTHKKRRGMRVFLFLSDAISVGVDKKREERKKKYLSRMRTFFACLFRLYRGLETITSVPDLEMIKQDKRNLTTSETI